LVAGLALYHTMGLVPDSVMRTSQLSLSSFSKDLPSVTGVVIEISCRKLDSPILEIFVGPNRNVFKVHQARLTEASPDKT
jgi:hypothetical protein